MTQQPTHRHSPAFDNALMNAGHALKAPDPIQALVRVLMAFRDEYRVEVLAELEALKPASIQTCRTCGAGYTYGQPCSSCEFQAQMALAQQQADRTGQGGAV